MEDYKSIGFVGLGLMGKPMAGHLATKLPEATKIHVFDVVPKTIEELFQEYPDRIVQGTSAKDVADKSVRNTCSTL